MFRSKKEIGLFGTIMMGLSGALGFEIFVLLDYAYFSLAGNDILWALLIAGILNIIIMFSYSELSAAIPKVGGEYTYIKTAYGGYISFISGCLRWLASIFTATLAALAFAFQVQFLLSILLPSISEIISPQIRLIAIIAITLILVMEIRGVKRIGTIMVFVILGILLSFALIGIFTNPLQDGLLSLSAPNRFLGIFSATVYVFPMFFGTRALVAGATKIKDPKKTLPRGLLISALLIIPIYFSITYVMTGVISPAEPQPTAPLLNFAAQKTMGIVGGILFGIAGIVASLSALGTSITVQSSIARGMSRDGYLPKFLLSIHRRFGTPYISIGIGALFVSVLCLLGTIEFLGYAASVGSLLVFALINLSLLRLRKNKPYMERPFKTPIYPLTPIIGLVLSVTLLIFPVMLQDVNATSAIVSGAFLIGLVMLGYYLRMVGHHRIKIAIGAASLGIGVFLVLSLFLSESQLVPSIFSDFPKHLLWIISVISIISGLLNVTSKGAA